MLMAGNMVLYASRCAKQRDRMYGRGVGEHEVQVRHRWPVSRVNPRVMLCCIAIYADHERLRDSCNVWR